MHASCTHGFTISKLSILLVVLGEVLDCGERSMSASFKPKIKKLSRPYPQASEKIHDVTEPVWDSEEALEHPMPTTQAG